MLHFPQPNRMIVLRPATLSHSHYFSSLQEFALPGSSPDFKRLGPPFAHGSASIAYREPGISVLRTDFLLGTEMMLVEAGGNPTPIPAAIPDYRFGFITLRNPAGQLIMHRSGAQKQAAGAKDLIYYVHGDEPVLIKYPPRLAISGLSIEVNSAWLEKHLPDLALLQDSGMQQQAVHSAPLSALKRLNEYRNFFDRLPGQEAARIQEQISGFIAFHTGLLQPAASYSQGAQDSIQRMDELIRSLMGKLHEPLPSVAEMSRKTGINIHTLRSMFKKTYGLPIGDFFIRQQMKWAAGALAHASVKQVGYSIGYHNLSHFANNFRKHQGVLPRALKR